MAELTLTLEQCEELRSRLARGEQVSEEEVAAAIRWLRQDRITAGQAKKTVGRKGTATNNSVKSLDLNALLDQIL